MPHVILIFPLPLRGEFGVGYMANDLSLVRNSRHSVNDMPDNLT